MTTHTTYTGRIVELATTAGPCRELLGDETLQVGRPVRCARRGVLVACDPGVSGRAVESCCRCDEHGGASAATASVLRAWGVVAPPEVGNDQAVIVAGTEELCSRHTYVVVREENARWIASLGIGGYTTHVRRLDVVPTRGGRGRRGGGASWPTRDEAVAAGVAAWRAEVDRRVAEITAMRGGTLAWGMPIAPRSAPVILMPERGQSAYAALRVAGLRAALPAAVVDRVAGGTRLGIERHEIIVEDADIVHVDGANWSHRSIESIAESVTTGPT